MSEIINKNIHPEYKQNIIPIREIKIIQRFIRFCLIKFNSLISINYRGDQITRKSIDVFLHKKRSENDDNNKKRENIIGAIINEKIPQKYFIYLLKWKKLKEEIVYYIKDLCKLKNVNTIYSLVCEHKAGRGNHYDFLLKINNELEFNIEFKFNVVSVNETPQFVSPMKPSQYLSESYENYFYNNYLTTLVQEYNLSLPCKDEYLKNVHSNKPICLKEHQEKYYMGCKRSSKFTNNQNDIDFYNSSNKASQESICNFIREYDLNIDKLTEYLLQTQKNKIYMLYKNNHFTLETVDLNNYTIIHVEKDPEHYRYLATTASGKKLKILMRWKNGNGIAYPAFQIS
tara:strand:+ start:1573 stop:2601 length:1029 start_codon:yes stop_codon:yes gene_type:complete